MIKIALAPCSPFSVTPEILRDTAVLARQYGVRCHTRSGAFGDPDDLSTMVRLVAGRTEPLKETTP
jgi:cytosine/adenosine deaminase-related metal-dependent hydrolase